MAQTEDVVGVGGVAFIWRGRMACKMQNRDIWNDTIFIYCVFVLFLRFFLPHFTAVNDSKHVTLQESNREYDFTQFQII